MSVWLILPRDPMIFRDGKPFNATPGAQAESLPFPYPSTIAGGVRTRAGMNADGQFDKQQIPRLLQLSIHGPVLVALDESGDINDWYFPAPNDCLMVEAGDKSQGLRHWAHPVDLPNGAATNLKHGLLVSVNPTLKQKPHKQAPQFWNWRTMQAWLNQPAKDAAPVDLSEIGISGLTPESRVHVRIDPETGIASEGFLFQTNGLEFLTTAQNEEDAKPKVLSELRRYGLAIESKANFAPGIDFLGGERRIVNWKQSNKTLLSCPQKIQDTIVNQKHCRLLLTTPAIFKQGYLPEWICKHTPELRVTIIAAAISRYQAVSGWNAEKGIQKASRRLAPAGSVYFLSLEGNAQAIKQFVDDIWMKSISDNVQDRRDGFGLALLGTWDGEIKPLEVRDENANSER